MYRSLIILFFVSLFTANEASAAVLPDAGQLLKENTPQSTLLPQQAMPPFQKKVKPEEHVQGMARIKVSGFIFTGNTLFSSSELAALMSGSIGKEMTLGELNDAAAAITTKYREKGCFLASVFFPPQSIKPGMPLIIEVIEGILENIHIETVPDKTRTPAALLQGYASHLQTGKPVEDAALTSMIMKTNELPNISSRIMLEPGLSPGTTQATFTVTEGKPCSFSLDMDNYGNEATGDNRAGCTIELYSPLHLGDQFSTHVQSSATGELQNLRANYSVPVMSYGTKIGLDYNFVTYHLGGSFKALNAGGVAHDLTIALTHPLVRQRTLILNATAAGEGRVLDDRTESPQSSNQRRTTSWQLGLAGIQMDRVPGSGTTSFSLGLAAGSLHITDAETLALDQSSTGLHTNGRYTKLNLSLARTQSISHEFSIYAGAYGQWCDKNLNSSEQLSMGGASAIRACQPGESYADKGIVTTAELRCQFGAIGDLPGRVQASAFIDHGNALLHNNPLPYSGPNTCNLTGAGVGIKWQDAESSTLQATCAWKVNGETTRSPMIYIQAVKRL